MVLMGYDALIVVDMQTDFMPGGSLAVPEGHSIIPVVNKYISLFQSQSLPIIFTRDWHPVDHCSFKRNGGIWPQHCIQNTPGANFVDGLIIPDTMILISKASQQDKDAYSGFKNTTLEGYLQRMNVCRVFVCGVATDYCILETVLDAIQHERGFETVFLIDAIKAVNIKPDDGRKAELTMAHEGAIPLEFGQLNRLVAQQEEQETSNL